MKKHNNKKRQKLVEKKDIRDTRKDNTL